MFILFDHDCHKLYNSIIIWFISIFRSGFQFYDNERSQFLTFVISLFATVFVATTFVTLGVVDAAASVASLSLEGIVTGKATTTKRNNLSIFGSDRATFETKARSRPDYNHWEFYSQWGKILTVLLPGDIQRKASGRTILKPKGKCPRVRFLLNLEASGISSNKGVPLYLRVLNLPRQHMRCIRCTTRAPR